MVVDEAGRTLRNAASSFRDYLEGLADEHPAHSAAAADQQWIEDSHHKLRAPRRRVLHQGLWAKSLTLQNVLDHVLAMERVLVGEPVGIWSHLSLSRVVQEGAVRVSHIYDPRASSEQRFALIGAAWVGDVQQHLTAAREFSSQSQLLVEAEQRWASTERTIQAAGLTIDRDRRGCPNRVVLGEARASCTFDLSGAAHARPSHLPVWYRLSSAASHSTSWLMQQATGFDAEGAITTYADTNTVTAAVLSVLGAFEDLTATLGSYHGRDPQRAVRTIQRRTVAVIERQRTAEQQMMQDFELMRSLEDI